jgi:HSP20 family protein
MAMTDLIPWGRGRNVPAQRGGDASPFLALHREMNRLFDDVFRGFDLSPFGDHLLERSMGWPNIEVSETDKDVKVAAELPGLDEKDVEVEFANGILTIKARRRPKRKTRIDDSASATTVASNGAFQSTMWTRTRCPPPSRTGC